MARHDRQAAPTFVDPAWPRDPRLTAREWAKAQKLMAAGVPPGTAADIALFRRVGPDVQRLSPADELALERFRKAKRQQVARERAAIRSDLAGARQDPQDFVVDIGGGMTLRAKVGPDQAPQGPGPGHPRRSDDDWLAAWPRRRSGK